MKKVGLIGWRGMVGSVLVKRMLDEGDFKRVSPYYFSTSSAGAEHVDALGVRRTLLDATSIPQLADMDVIVSCQGGDYTKAVHNDLRGGGWSGYWIDAASAKRMDADSIIVLDPLNHEQIHAGLDSGIKNFIGGNCSITLTLLGLAGLFREGLVDWLSTMTYQAASGAGAANVRELLSQMAHLSDKVRSALDDPGTPVIDIVAQARDALADPALPRDAFGGVALAGSLIPWIDADLGNGISREEWKGEVETNKILGLPPGTIGVDGLCIRVPVLQSHAAAVTLKLKEDLPVHRLESIIQNAHEWVEYVPNLRADTLRRLSPAAVSGTLKVGVGRLRKLGLADNLYSVFTVGDQLLWGAAEPLRRMLGILLER
ncbi:aspartate-semialdehyde dehydrogenase [Burkholderia sp. TSV86]|uniref:aspartate-semialdehyde dehydrogenase n=1 Tax=Burkholderia sp. TSV86 TaxID=1385594 RepID=UPI0007522277|nr:aspartate-semialdehyde dehydrogenase [Burkholderia sp. TSV86]KVE39324.1 aspartate-semialdehyde dehydrogenase [Burkholderia sp. TSV86]